MVVIAGAVLLGCAAFLYSLFLPLDICASVRILCMRLVLSIFADTIVDSHWIATDITSKIEDIPTCFLVKVKQNIVYRMC